MYPDERPEDGYSRENSYRTTYVNIQAKKEMARRIAESKASLLEKIYVNEDKYPLVSRKQLKGETLLDAPEEQVYDEINRDKMIEIMKKTRGRI